MSDAMRLLTVAELSERTGVEKWRVYELVKKGKGPPHMRIGRTLRFPADGITQWIRQQTNSHKEES